MFKQSPGYRMPVANVEKITIYPASLGGGIVVELQLSGKTETMVFSSQQALEQNLFAMFRAASIAQHGANPAAPPTGAALPNLPQGVPAKALANIVKAEGAEKKKRGGRPKGSKNRPKSNGHDVEAQSQEQPKVEAAKEAEVALS